jgi:hypothetical protein
MRDEKPDLVAEYIERRNTVAAAKPSPLGLGPAGGEEKPPAPTGDPVGDFLAVRNYHAARRPSPFKGA